MKQKYTPKNRKGKKSNRIEIVGTCNLVWKKTCSRIHLDISMKEKNISQDNFFDESQIFASFAANRDQAGH